MRSQPLLKLFLILSLFCASACKEDQKSQKQEATKVSTARSLPEGITKSDFKGYEAAKDFKGVFIWPSEDREYSRDQNQFEINGICGIFVNSGAAMSTWEPFPQSVIFTVKDLSTGKEYETSYLEMSISWDGDVDFGPSNQVVQNTFSRNLFYSHQFKGVERLTDVVAPGTKVEITARFEDMTSNTILMELK